MSRYIDADALMKNVDKYPYAQGLMDLIADIQTAPSINIVRCKDCKYWVSDGGALMRCDIHKDPTVPNHYCSYGEEDKDE